MDRSCSKTKQRPKTSDTSVVHHNTALQAHITPSAPECPDGASRTDENEETIITSIQATDAALGLRRIPAGFYAVVHHSGLEWKTKNKWSSVNDNVIGWDESIPIPSDLSVTVCIEICASQPTLGAGEQLRKLTITVEQLLCHSTEHLPFILFPKDGDVVSPCSRISITVEQRKRGNSDSSTPRVLDPHRSTTETQGELEDATNRGHGTLSRYRKYEGKKDLEHSIGEFERALSVCPLDHSCRAAAQSNLAIAKFILCQVEGTDATLDVPYSLYSNALVARAVGHRDRPSTLIQLAAVHLARSERRGDEVEGARAEVLLNEAIGLSSTGSHEKRAAAFTLQLHAGRRVGPGQEDGRLSWKDNSAAHFQDEDPWNLSVELLDRFQRLGDPAHLQRAIALLEELVMFTSVSDHRYLTSLGNLGLASWHRFERFGELSDLEDAITRFKNAVDLTPHGHPDKPRRLNNLGNAFLTRFRRIGELGDLEDTITRHRNAVDLTPHAHPNKLGRLNNLANAFLTRFERIGGLSDLDNAITRHSDAVDLAPHGHPDKPGCLSNLGNAFRARFERIGELSDLEDAITRFKDAVDLTPHGHPDKPRRLNNLGNAFLTRFQRTGELGDLDNAIMRHRDAVDLTPHGHPDKPTCLNNLGSAFYIGFEHIGGPSNLKQAIFLYSCAASASTGPIRIRFQASKNWILCARHELHHSLLHAYSTALSLLPELAWIGLSFSHRYDELDRGADIVREAAAAALDSELPEIAVEWLEQGRSVVWGELFRLRSLYEELSGSHPDHARRLRELSATLEHASATRDKFSEQISSATLPATESLKQKADKHRAVAIERDKLLQEIRAFPGFEQFLLNKNFSQLRASAHSGPVVMLNAAENRCDALIILANLDHVIHVPLPNFPSKRSAGLQKMLEELVGHIRVIPCDGRKGDPATLHGISWESLLAALWNGVVKPVLDALAFSTPGDLSRIFWCPTGPFVFLPIHAAGLYGTQRSQPGHKVSEFVISSYVPTLSILALSPNSPAVPSGALRLLTVPQPPSDGLPHLSGVAIELEHIKEIIRKSPSAQTTLLESSVGTVEEVLDLLKQADWVHFACHGIQDPVNRTESGLCLADRRRLKVSDIIALSRPHGGLAYLSACETATGDKGLSDEAIHIAVGMLFAGYRGVIGTMWSISDDLAPHVAWDVYTQLFRNGARPDYREAARALHDAVEHLRDRRKAPFHTWLPFIHVGL